MIQIHLTANTAFAHPIIYRRIEDAKAKNPNLKIIVVDPRRTDTAQAADLHLAILPGTDVALFNGMLHVMLWEGLLDMAYINAHTNGFDALKDTVREYTPKMVSNICDIKEADIITAAKWVGKGPSLSMYSVGLNQSIHGTDKNAALINLHLATGQIRRRAVLTDRSAKCHGRTRSRRDGQFIIRSPRFSQCGS